MRIGSLFSGIGGLELGLEWSGIGHTVWQVEKDAFCRRKLAWRWPDAQRFEDVRAVGAANLSTVDLICGGFPCQDVSSAGKRAGLAGARSGLWAEFARIAAELRPRWVVVENVRSGAAAWIDPVRGALERLCYASLPVPVAASDCGAPHERARVFIVACRGREAADAVHGRGPVAEDATPHADRAELWDPSEGRPSSVQPEASGPDANHNARFLHAQPRQDVRDAQRHGGWATEPAVARVVHGLPGRVDYERALGNSVVPQCAEVVGHVIRQLLEAP